MFQFSLLVSVALAALVYAACDCPPFDTGFYPTSSTSSLVGTLTRCYYPGLSRCQYSTTTGALLRDSDAGLCRATAPLLTTCPTTDLASFALGPGSGVHGTTLYCTYPTTTELASTTYYCDYTDAGALSADLDAGLCPATASCTSAPPVGSGTSTTPITTVSTTRAGTTVTNRPPTTPTPGITRTSSSGQFSNAPASISASPSTTARSNSKNTTAIAVGASVGGIVLIAGALIAFFLLRKKPAPKANTTSFGDSPPMSAAPLNPYANNVAADPNWPPNSPPPPSVLPNPYGSPPPPEGYSQYTSSPSPNPGQNTGTWSQYSAVPSNDPYQQGPNAPLYQQPNTGPYAQPNTGLYPQGANTGPNPSYAYGTGPNRPNRPEL